MERLLASLRDTLGSQGFIADPSAEPRYHADWSPQPAQSPSAVLRPNSTEEVAKALSLCNTARQPVVIQGGLTGLSGGATPHPGEIGLSLERMNRIEDLDSLSMTMTAQAGTPLQAIQEAAEAVGLQFPLDLGARGSCNIGGNIATNAGGNQVIRYGMTRNLVLGLEAVLADGTVISSMNRMLKNNAGYDLKQLFIGTEGTLGIVTRAVLRLFPRIGNKCTALCAVDSFAHAVDLLHLLGKRFGGELSTFEAMWASYFDTICERLPAARSPFDSNGHPLYALVEIETADEAEGTARLEAALTQALETGLIQDAALAQSSREAQSFWAIRDGVADLPDLLKKSAAFDVSVPTSVMERFVADVDTALAKRFDTYENLVFGHLGDNNLHFLVTTPDPEDYERINEAIYTTVGQYQGSVSAEHGVGMLRKNYLAHSRNPAEIALMRQLKTSLDPNNILNPGRVF
jgi:FAD/FMN-containing dehydrogenase